MPKKSRKHGKMKGGKTTTLGLMKGYSYLRRSLILNKDKKDSYYSDPDCWRLPYITINYNIRTQNIYEGASVLRFGAPASDEYELYNPATCKVVREFAVLGETTIYATKEGDDIRTLNASLINDDELKPMTFDVWEYRLRMCDVFNILGNLNPSLVWRNKSTGEEISMWDRVLPYGDIRDDKNQIVMRVIFNA